MKRAQLLWNMHNSFETRTTLAKRRSTKTNLNHTMPMSLQLYITVISCVSLYIYIYHYISCSNMQYLSVPVILDMIGWFQIPYGLRWLHFLRFAGSASEKNVWHTKRSELQQYEQTWSYLDTFGRFWAHHGHIMETWYLLHHYGWKVIKHCRIENVPNDSPQLAWPTLTKKESYKAAPGPYYPSPVVRFRLGGTVTPGPFKVTAKGRGCTLGRSAAYSTSPCKQCKTWICLKEILLKNMCICYIFSHNKKISV